MSGKKSASAQHLGSDLARVDAHVIASDEYDEAPELTPEALQSGTCKVAGQPVAAPEGPAGGRKALGRPPVAVKRPMLSMRTDPDVLASLRASGKGWQTRVNALLREAADQGRFGH
ncbi:MAG: hypothetical protein JWQ03_1846 [Variovorax sp.]|nr:hypothetical protein [Variovorax sp.]